MTRPHPSVFAAVSGLRDPPRLARRCLLVPSSCSPRARTFSSSMLLASSYTASLYTQLTGCWSVVLCLCTIVRVCMGRGSFHNRNSALALFSRVLGVQHLKVAGVAINCNHVSRVTSDQATIDMLLSHCFPGACSVSW